jgi:hypothetical protein
LPPPEQAPYLLRSSLFGLPGALPIGVGTSHLGECVLYHLRVVLIRGLDKGRSGEIPGARPRVTSFRQTASGRSCLLAPPLRSRAVSPPMKKKRGGAVADAALSVLRFPPAWHWWVSEARPTGEGLNTSLLSEEHVAQQSGCQIRGSGLKMTENREIQGPRGSAGCTGPGRSCSRRWASFHRNQSPVWDFSHAREMGGTFSGGGGGGQSQQIRGSCSPLSMSTTRMPPTRLRR